MTNITKACSNCAQSNDVFGGLTVEEITGFTFQSSVPVKVKVRKGLPTEIGVQCSNCGEYAIWDLDQGQYTLVDYTERI